MKTRLLITIGLLISSNMMAYDITYEKTFKVKGFCDDGESFIAFKDNDSTSNPWYVRGSTGKRIEEIWIGTPWDAIQESCAEGKWRKK